MFLKVSPAEARDKNSMQENYLPKSNAVYLQYICYQHQTVFKQNLKLYCAMLQCGAVTKVVTKEHTQKIYVILNKRKNFLVFINMQLTHLKDIL